jgi:hypothetical protein
MNNVVKSKPSRRIPLTKSVTKETLEGLYFTQGKSLEDIAKEFNCTRQMVKLLMERYGIERRKRSEARVLAIKGGKFDRLEYHDINEDFFSVWSPAMAWILGLIFTDGCMQGDKKGQRVSISSMDLELLEKVRNHLGSTRLIRKCIQSYDKTKHIFQLDFYREKMRDDLQRLGLVQRKSLIMKFPDVPEEYMPHFIRGCWDGDGSVYMSGGKLNASYVTGSRDFLERLVAELFRAGICRVRTSASPDTFKLLKQIFGEGFCKEHIADIVLSDTLNIHTEKRSNAYSIKLNSLDNLENLFHYLYDGIDETLYLKRKYDVFVEGLPLMKAKRRRE